MFADESKVVWGQLVEDNGDWGHFSEPCVMKSNAGFYIGTAFKHQVPGPMGGLIEPQERLTGYMTREMAEKHLEFYKTKK